MEMITVTAKTVEDAITQASLQLGVSSDRIQEVPEFLADSLVPSRQ